MTRSYVFRHRSKLRWRNNHREVIAHVGRLMLDACRNHTITINQLYYRSDMIRVAEARRVILKSIRVMTGYQRIQGVSYFKFSTREKRHPQRWRRRTGWFAPTEDQIVAMLGWDRPLQVSHRWYLPEWYRKINSGFIMSPGNRRRLN